MNLPTRVLYLDIIRALAIFMVLITHATEVFYIGDGGIIQIAEGNAFWVNLINSAVRSCVPLFVIISGYLLLPIKQPASEFYKKRLTKIFIPFVIWSVLYVLLPMLWTNTSWDVAQKDLLRLTYNFNWASGHLWFMYMLLGVYLFIPIISPWLEKCSRRFEEAFLGVWAFTTLYHYIIQFIPDHMMLGESFWNEFSAIYYFSGYIGYVVLGHYIKKYITWDRKKSLVIGIPLFLAGFAITFLVFRHQLGIATTLKELELSWRFCTINVALMATGILLIFKDVTIRKIFILNPVLEVSKFSFGIYLVHLLLMGFMFKLIGSSFPIYVTIVYAACLNLIASYIVVKSLSFLPKSGYLISV